MFVQMTDKMNFSKLQREDQGVMIKPSNIIHFEYKETTRVGTIIVEFKHGSLKGKWIGSCMFDETRDAIRAKRGTIWVFLAKPYSESSVTL